MTLKNRVCKYVNKGTDKTWKNSRTNETENGNGRMLELGLLNIRGLTKEKFYEVNEMINETPNMILFTLETHHKREKIMIPDNLLYLSHMREEMDKRGGGMARKHNRNNF